MVSSWKILNQVLDCSKPKVVGILNLTPDSFSDGGQYIQPKKALVHAEEMVEEGADILDLGAESTRPGAQEVLLEEEWQRLYPVLKTIRPRLKLPISIDTQKGEIARRALEEGADIINDVSGGSDTQLLKAVQKSGAGLVLMHRRGKAFNMMEHAYYDHLYEEVLLELKASLQKALAWEIDLQNICLDPGFGFAKTTSQNWELFGKIKEMRLSLQRPLWVGVSRKRMIKAQVGEDLEQIEAASVQAALEAAKQGASFLRVHAVGKTRQALKRL
ncbi:MAG: dihydropteroate synthase [Deltaproteobacteria bacterium]|nr:dihydropteroate synthase [Deltaproteobacteria bacterium]